MSDRREEGPSIWSDLDLPEGADRRFRIGPLELRVRRVADEIRLAHARDPSTEDAGPSHPGAGPHPVGGEPDADPLGDDAHWSRWAAPPEATRLRLVPAFPDRPLVVEPEDAFHLLRGARARIYVRVPLWARLELPAEAGTTTLTEIPTTILSDTWFGDFVEGELCYYLPTSARREVRPELFDPDRVICPFELTNRSESDLPVEKIALRVGHLSVFRRDGELWADETLVQYRGEDEGSEIRVTGEPPSAARDAELLTPPRAPMERGLRARTFARLKHLGGLGFSA